MSAFAVRACVLIRLQARRGEWVPLAALMSHLGVREERVRHVCQQLVDAGDAHHGARDGQDFFGIGVEGAALPLLSTTERTA